MEGLLSLGRLLPGLTLRRRLTLLYRLALGRGRTLRRLALLWSCTLREGGVGGRLRSRRLVSWSLAEVGNWRLTRWRGALSKSDVAERQPSRKSERSKKIGWFFKWHNHQLCPSLWSSAIRQRNLYQFLP